MPNASSRVVPLPDGYNPIELPKSNPTASLEETNMNLQPGMNTNLRSTLPPIFAATDNSRQFYVGGNAPQYRILPAQPLMK